MIPESSQRKCTAPSWDPSKGNIFEWIRDMTDAKRRESPPPSDGFQRYDLKKV